MVAGPSGYGLPLIAAHDCSLRERRLMTLTRRDDSHARGVSGFSALVEAFCSSELPTVFLPGVIHLDTVPTPRKYNRIDLGTADKVCVAALALASEAQRSCCLVELGSAFTACLALVDGQIVDGIGGSSGPVGWHSPGAWDGELAYLIGPLSKEDLFLGGAGTIPEPLWLIESVVRVVAGMLAMHRGEQIVLAGRLLQTQPQIAQEIEQALANLGPVKRLANLEGAWVKHAAQGAAILADGLASGRYHALVERLGLRRACGTVLDYIVHPRGRLLMGEFADSE